MQKEITIPNDDFFEALLDELRESGSVVLKVKGFSMFPFFRNEKDCAVLANLAPGEMVEPGKVYLFRYQGRYVFHRCKRKSPRGEVFYFKGDGNLVGLEYCGREDVLAVLVKRISPSAKEWACDSFSWKLSSALWPDNYLLRRLFLGVLRRIYK